MSLKPLEDFIGDLNSTPTFPALFIGHGSPMNGIEDNEFSKEWAKLGQQIPEPRAVLCISAHWLTRGTHVTAMSAPRTIHDFGGFPRSLYEVDYPSPGDPELATYIQKSTESPIGLDHEWGLDHGTWTVVKHMYPEANIPVLQLSIDYHQPAGHHYSLAKELQHLRNKGVLIIGSGNMVHNLGMIDFTKSDESYGFDWALEMDQIFKDKILAGDHRSLIDYHNLSTSAQFAIPTPDHYFPLLYVLGMMSNKEDIEIFNDKPMGGSITMTSLLSSV